MRLVAGTGLWMLQPWGWQLAQARATVQLGTHLVAMIRGALTPSVVAGAVVNGAVLYYLSRPEVRRTLTGGPSDVPSTTTW
jgi:uncharacterized membrane protein (DUF2068 family)